MRPDIMPSARKRITPLIEYASESATACLVTMVQGNILALTVTHLVTASQTGIVAGVIASLAIVAARTRRRWIISAVLGIATGFVDYFMHPGMFGSGATEAVVTGSGAALLSYFFGTAVQLIREKRAARISMNRDDLSK